MNIINTFIIDPNSKIYNLEINNIINNYKNIKIEKLINNLEKVTFSSNESIVFNNSIIPMSFSLEISEFEIENYKEKIKNIIQKELGIIVNYVNYNQFQDYIEFLPFNDDNLIYISFNIYSKLISKLNDFNSNDYFNFKLEDDNILENRQITRIEANNLNNLRINMGDNHKIIGKIDGVLDVIPSIKYTYLVELANFFSNRINKQYNQGIVLEYKNNMYEESNIQYIKRGMLPRFRFEGYWQLLSLQDLPKILYCINTSYLEISSRYINDIEIFDDLSFNAVIINQEHYENVYSQLLRNLKNMDKLNSYKCTDLLDAIKKRYNTKDSSLIVNHKSDYWIVSSQKLTFQYDDNLKNDLVKFMKQHCKYIWDDNGQKTDLNNMNLNSLLEIIYSDGYSDCYNKFYLDILKDTGFPIDSLLRKEITINRYLYMQYSILGYFDFGPIQGLLRNNEWNREILKIPGDIEAVVRTDYLVENNPVIEFNFKSTKGNRELFNITISDFIHNIEELELIVKSLWDKDWFLSEWGYQYYINTGKLSMSAIKKYDFLSKGVDSIERGDLVFKLLKSIDDKQTLFLK